MKTWKVTIYINGKPPIHTMVQANYQSDAKRLIEAQYGSLVRSVSIQEVK